MIEFILEHNIRPEIDQPAADLWRQVVAEMPKVRAPRQRNDAHPVAGVAQMLHQPAVIQVPAGQRLEVAVDHQTEVH